MSADEDTELRDLVAQTLESNGVLGKIRAQLRTSVFLALEEQESLENKTPFSNPALKKFLNTKEGQTVAGLVKEFLEFFNLEFTLAVFEPEAGLESLSGNRSSLAQELSVSNRGDSPDVPLFVEVLRRSQGTKSSNAKSSEDLSSKQLADAKKKFDLYDKDRNGEIDKDELRELFTDIFPNFNRNMIDRYVNDEFKAADKDFSCSITFDEFHGMYKRLFLQCRTVVSGESSASLFRSRERSTSPHSQSRSERSFVDSKNQKNLLSGRDVRNGPKHAADVDLLGGSDIDEDPFFDDPVVGSTGGLKSYGSSSSEDHSQSGSRREAKGRPSQIPVYSSRSSSSSDDRKVNGSAKSPGLSSLSGLPMLNQQKGRKQDSESDDLRAMDRGMAGLGLEGDNDFDYEDDDFHSSGHSFSTKSPRTLSKSEQKSLNDNGSIAEEIEEEIDDISVDADDLLKSERSGYDDLTTDRTISQHDGFDYIEDVQSP